MVKKDAKSRVAANKMVVIITILMIKFNNDIKYSGEFGAKTKFT